MDEIETQDGDRIQVGPVLTENEFTLTILYGPTQATTFLTANQTLELIEVLWSRLSERIRP